MPSLLQALLTDVLVYKYVAIFLITFLGALALPLPSNSIVTASAFFALQGYLSLPFVFLAGLLGNIAGDLSAYVLARTYGTRIFKRIGLGKALAAPTVKGVEQKIYQHPFSTVFFSRFVTALTPVVNVFAGMARVSLATFLVAETVGAIGEITIACAMGVIFGDNWQYIQDLLGKVASIVCVILILLIVVVWRARKRAK